MVKARRAIMQARCLRSILAILLVGISGCATTKLQGSFATEGPVLGQKTFQPTSCYSGDREYFFGVDLTSKVDPMQIRILQDPVKGTFVKVITGAEGTSSELLFDGVSCKVLRGNLQQTKWRVNDIRDMSGELELDCDASGETIRGTIVFHHCH
jgi:hypothetical protein